MDSLFRQNRVTVPRETGVSSGNFVSDPLTPRDEIAVTMPSNNKADVVTGAAAMAFNNRSRPGSGAGSNASIETPTDSYNANEYDSFTGRHNAPSMVSVASSGAYQTNSEFHRTNSGVLRGQLSRQHRAVGHVQPAVRAASRVPHTPRDGRSLADSVLEARFVGHVDRRRAARHPPLGPI